MPILRLQLKQNANKNLTIDKNKQRSCTNPKYLVSTYKEVHDCKNVLRNLPSHTSSLQKPSGLTYTEEETNSEGRQIKTKVTAGMVFLCRNLG